MLNAITKTKFFSWFFLAALVIIAGCDTQTVEDSSTTTASYVYKEQPVIPVGAVKRIQPAGTHLVVEGEGKTAFGTVQPLAGLDSLHIYFQPTERDATLRTTLWGFVGSREARLAETVLTRNGEGTRVLQAHFRDMMPYIRDSVKVTFLKEGRVQHEGYIPLGKEGDLTMATYPAYSEGDEPTSTYWAYIDGTWILMYDWTEEVSPGEFISDPTMLEPAFGERVGPVETDYLRIEFTFGKPGVTADRLEMMVENSDQFVLTDIERW